MGLFLGCGPTPSEVVGSTDGTTNPSTTTASTSGATTAGSTGAVDPDGEGSGRATGHGTASSDGGTTQGVGPDTSTGEATTAETATTGPAGTSTGGDASTSTGASPSCDELYGAAPNYELCMETSDECHFATSTGGGNCNELCAMFEGTCIDAFDNSTGCTVIRPDTDTCDTNRSTEICVCSK